MNVSIFLTKGSNLKFTGGYVNKAAKILRHSVRGSVKSTRLSAAVVPKWVECSQGSRIEFVS